MYSLFDRLKGGDGVPKIPLHIFIGVFQDWIDGDITQPEMVDILGLEGGQVGEIMWIRGAYEAAPDPSKFVRKLKNQLYCAEWRGTREAYGDEVQLYARLQGEVARQGGTPPELT